METPAVNEAPSDEETELIEELADEEEPEIFHGISSISFPAATIRKLLKEAAPDARFSADCLEAFNRCCAVFIYYISAASQESVASAKRTILQPSDVNEALNDCGFAEIAEESRRSLGIENLTNSKKRKRP